LLSGLISFRFFFYFRSDACPLFFSPRFCFLFFSAQASAHTRNILSSLAAYPSRPTLPPSFFSLRRHRPPSPSSPYPTKSPLVEGPAKNGYFFLDFRLFPQAIVVRFPEFPPASFSGKDATQFSQQSPFGFRNPPPIVGLFVHLQLELEEHNPVQGPPFFPGPFCFSQRYTAIQRTVPVPIRKTMCLPFLDGLSPEI